MLTPEQLLLRRFKYVQPYPDSQYRLGEIITIVVEQTEAWIMQKVQRDPEGIGDKELWYDATKFWEFKANFRELNWWEERRLEDLPRYITLRPRCSTRSTVFEISEWNMQMDKVKLLNQPWTKNGWIKLNCYLPAD